MTHDKHYTTIATERTDPDELAEQTDGITAEETGELLTEDDLREGTQIGIIHNPSGYEYSNVGFYTITDVYTDDRGTERITIEDIHNGEQHNKRLDDLGIIPYQESVTDNDHYNSAHAVFSTSNDIESRLED